jgi:hypothetical protein
MRSVASPQGPGSLLTRSLLRSAAGPSCTIARSVKGRTIVTLHQQVSEVSSKFLRILQRGP